MGVLIFFISGALLLVAALFFWSRGDALDIKRVQEVLMALDKRVQDLQAKQARYNEQMFSHERKLEECDVALAAFKKRVDDMEFHVLKPRAINVTLTKPIEIAPLRVRHSSRKKKLTDSEARKAVIDRAKSQVKELSQ